MIYNLKKLSNDQSDAKVILNEVKRYLRLSTNEEDSFLIDLIKSSISMLENYINKSVFNKKLQLQTDYCDQTNSLSLPFAPVKEIEVVNLVSKKTGKMIPIENNKYKLQAGDILYFDNFFLNNLNYHKQYLVINYHTSGIFKEIIENQEMALKQALFAHIAYLYDNRGNNISFPQFIKNAYGKYHDFRI